MSLKKLGVALLAVFVMGAIVANSAYAENEFKETGGQWYTGASPGTKLAVGATENTTVSGGASFLTSTIAAEPIRFDSTSVAGETCLFTNSTSTTATLDCKALKFSGVTVSGEAATGCSTPTTITTKELTAVLGMNKAGTLATLKITPRTGTTFATVELTGACANAGLYKVTGTVFAEVNNATGVFGKTQKITFSEAIQKSAGTATALKFGEYRAFLNGSLEGTASVEWAGRENSGEENEFKETGGQWYTGASPGTKLAVGATENTTVSGGASFLTSTIAAEPIRFDSTSVAGETCLFTNSTSTTATLDCKALKFSGVTVSGEAATGCSTPTTITTKELTAVLGMNKAGTLATLKITPRTGTTFATVELTGACANAGLYKVTGTVFAEVNNATGVFGKTQKITFSEAIQKSAGTATALKFGEYRAFLNGSLEGTASVEWAGREHNVFAENNWSATTGSWYTGASPGTKLAVGTGTIDLTVSGGASVLTGEIAGKDIRFDSTSVGGTECSATNPTSSSTTIDCKNLVFTEVTVSGSAATGCTTESTITTKELTGVLGMNKAGTLATLKITPKAGEGTTFATVNLLGPCANAGLYKVTGTVYAQAANATGVFANTQKLTVSEAVQGDAGTPTSLKFGENGAFLNGSLSATAAVEWAAKEK